MESLCSLNTCLDRLLSSETCVNYVFIRDAATHRFADRICVDASEVPRVHNEFNLALVAVATVHHIDFDSLRQGVLDACPYRYRCLEPMALYHDLNIKKGSDRLRHAVDFMEYKATNGQIPCVSVEVIEAKKAKPGLLLAQIR